MLNKIRVWVNPAENSINRSVPSTHLFFFLPLKILKAYFHDIRYSSPKEQKESSTSTIDWFTSLHEWIYILICFSLLKEDLGYFTFSNTINITKVSIF